MVAMSSTVSPSMVDRNVDLYLNLLRVLERQVTTMEQDFFEVRVRCFVLFSSVHVLTTWLFHMQFVLVGH